MDFYAKNTNTYEQIALHGLVLKLIFMSKKRKFNIW